ncbi:MAG: response regulator [Pseudomonadota bacterium]
MDYMQRVGSLLGLRRRDRRRRRRIEASEGIRILVIDDSLTVVKVLSRMFRQNDFEPIGAGTAEEGLEIARESQPDLIFLDIMLPGMNGFAALRRLRHDPATARIPVIMISGDEQSMARMVLDRMGSDDFMKKPFGRAEVFTRIERLVLDGRLPPRAAEVRMDMHAG